MFWNGKKLESKKSSLIELDGSDDLGKVKVDCASIELTVGSEVYITPSSENDQLFDSKYVKSYTSPVTKMGSNRVSDMTGDIFSPFKLKKELDDLKEKYNKEILSIKEEMHKSEGRLMIRHILLLLGIGGLLIAITRLDKIIPLLKGMFGY